MKIVGLMSGTSADGIDGALVELSGASPNLTYQLIHHTLTPFDPDLRSTIFQAFDDQKSSSSLLCSLNFRLGRAFADAALATIRGAGLTPDQVDLIGSHGQTIWHIPEGSDASTLQLGEPSLIAEITQITTISNFRPRDMAVGGQGAPLVPLVDAILLTHPSLDRAAQNIGGMANVTFLPAGDPSKASAFDTGPGNALIDAAITRISNGERRFDEGGEVASRGIPCWTLVDHWISQDPYFSQTPPRTTGREKFGVAREAEMFTEVQKGSFGNLSDADYVATLTGLTARSISHAYRKFLPRMPQEVVVSGGGTSNPTLIKMLQEELSPIQVKISDEIGLKSASKEAVAFAILAYETWHGRPGNLPAATGASKTVVLGSITPAANFWRLRPGEGKD